MSKKSNHLNTGKRKEFAFVFSAPGQEESKKGKPVSGVTGENLKILLGLLDVECNCRYDFTITNSYNKVLFKEKDGKTEASIKDIQKTENINRLFKELKDTSGYIIFFGKKAQSVAYLLTDLKAKFIFSRHLGLQSINQIEKDIDGNELISGNEGNTKKRLEVIARFIKKQINGCL